MQKTAYDMRICDWRSDVCSSDRLAESFSWSRRPSRRRQGAGRPARSCEQPVDIPARIGLFVVKPVTEQPVAAAQPVLDAVIVAGQAGIVAAAPPFGGDAFRSLVPAHRVDGPAAAGTLRRAGGTVRGHLHPTATAVCWGQGGEEG